MKTTAPEAISEILDIVRRLCETYPHKKFTLDGRLLGDLGEILVEQAYDVTLFSGLKRHHDARCSDNRLVQIKATMKDKLTFPVDHIPRYYIGVQIDANGSLKEVFNGPGAIARKAVRNRRTPKTNLHSVSIKVLHKLQQEVPQEKRIPLRQRT